MKNSKISEEEGGGGSGGDGLGWGWGASLGWEGGLSGMNPEAIVATKYGEPYSPPGEIYSEYDRKLNKPKCTEALPRLQLREPTLSAPRAQQVHLLDVKLEVGDLLSGVQSGERAWAWFGCDSKDQRNQQELAELYQGRSGIEAVIPLWEGVLRGESMAADVDSKVKLMGNAASGCRTDLPEVVRRACEEVEHFEWSEEGVHVLRLFGASMQMPFVGEGPFDRARARNEIERQRHGLDVIDRMIRERGGTVPEF